MNIQHTSLRYSGLLAFFFSHIAFATCVVNSVPDASIQDAIDAAAPGDTITVSGTCPLSNLVFWKDDITLQGTGIISPDPKTIAPTVLITAKNVTIAGTAPRLRFTQGRDNTIRIENGASARIVRVNVNSARHNNIVVTGKSSATFQYMNSTSAQQGTVSGRGRGIVIEDGSTVHLDRVILSGNTGIGMYIDESWAEIINSEIRGNGGGLVAQNSTLHIGAVNGNPGNVLITNNGGNNIVKVSHNSTVSFANTEFSGNPEASTQLLANASTIKLLGGNWFQLDINAPTNQRTIVLNSSSLIQSSEGNNIEDTLLPGGSGNFLQVGIMALSSYISLHNIYIPSSGSAIYLIESSLIAGTLGPGQRIYISESIYDLYSSVQVGNIGSGGWLPTCNSGSCGYIDYPEMLAH